MATKEQAKTTWEMTKAFYMFGVKSSNKCYYGIGKVKADAIDLEPNAQLNQRQQDRNAQQLLNRRDMIADRQVKNRGKTPYEIGETLWLNGTTLGNCGEMAAVAVYLAIVGAQVPRGEVAHWTLRNRVEGGIFGKDRSFGHSFAVLGDGTPANSWVVDPWADLVCRLSKFSDELAAKLKYWTSMGKRIAAEMPDGTCWVEPTNDMITGILGRSAKWSRVYADEKGG